MSEIERRLRASRAKEGETRQANGRLMIRMGCTGATGLLVGASASAYFFFGAGAKFHFSAGLVAAIVSAYWIRHVSEASIKRFRNSHDL